MFGDEAEQMEEVIDAERKALQKEATDLATTEGGSAVASATQSLMFMEDEEDAEGRKRRITQSFEEGGNASCLPHAALHRPPLPCPPTSHHHASTLRHGLLVMSIP